MAAEHIHLGNWQSPDVLEQLKSDILKALPGGDVRIETAALTSVGFPLLQLLISAQSEAAIHDTCLRISAPTGGCVDQALDQFGLREAISVQPVVENGEWIGLNRIGANE